MRMETIPTVELLEASRSDIVTAIEKSLENYRVAALTQRAGRYLYAYISSSDELILDCHPTVLSPKKFFFPQEEALLEFSSQGKITPRIDAEPMILFGLRPCDLTAVQLMDEAFAAFQVDPNYLSKREKAVIVGIDCSKPCDAQAFCYKVKSHENESAADIFLYETGDSYLVSIRTVRGKEFASDYLAAHEGLQSTLDAVRQKKTEAFSAEKPFQFLDHIPDLLEKNRNHEIWQKEGARCLSCGSCTMVCPTCYCFDVNDEWNLNLKTGQRIRRWDACVLNDFAVVASGENFREKPSSRIFHRINRKFNWLMKKHAQPACIGCGRCVRACLSEINPKTIVEELTCDHQ